MKKLLLTAVSATALLTAGGAIAAGERTQNQSDTPTVTTEDVKKGWENTKDAVSETASEAKENVSEAAHDAKEATKEAYSDLKDALSEEQKQAASNVDTTDVQIPAESLASHMIGQTVTNTMNERVGKVNDIILDKDGNAELAIIGDGDFFGIGKEVAVDYEMVAKTDEYGVVVPLTEEAIERAVEFSYVATDAPNVQVMPMDAISVDQALNGKIVDPQGKPLASIDDIIIENGDAEQFVIAYNETLGMGGQQAALSFDDVKAMHKDGKTHFSLDAKKSAMFRNFAKTANN